MPDIIDAGCELEQHLRENALKAHELRRKRAQAGDGYCVDCGDAIPQSRLTANPYAQRCIACQEAHEKRGRHFA